MYDPYDNDHIATGNESLREFAENAGMDNPERPWLLDSRDVWVRNPYYSGPPVDDPETEMYNELNRQQQEAAKNCP